MHPTSGGRGHHPLEEVSSVSNEPELRGEPSPEETPSLKERSTSTGENDDAVIDRHRHSRWTAYAYVFTAMLVVLVGRLLSYWLAKERLGKEGFDEFALARSVFALVFPVLFLGLVKDAIHLLPDLRQLFAFPW